jgi:hypothetical protein
MTVEELKALPTAEKFQIMETLWEDLRARYDAVPISQEIIGLARCPPGALSKRCFPDARLG